MTPDDFSAVFDRFRATTVRWETLPVYAVGGAEAARIEAFRAGAPRPERSVRTNSWLARIATSTVAGKRWSRVRVVDDPLTEYQRFQLTGYVESQAVGESIRLVARDALDGAGPDFWLFDEGLPGACAVVLHYHDDGRPDRRELVTGSDGTDRLASIVRAADAKAVPLNEFLVSSAVRG